MDAYAEADKLGSNCLSGKILSKIVYQNLKTLNYDPQKMASVTTDSCATMASPDIGACVELKKMIQHLVILFCQNHRTNLAILDRLKICPELQRIVKLIKTIKKFFCSAKEAKKLKKQYLEHKKYAFGF